ncbi:MAG TPA: GNAT family N-acyltransferase [Candidatus Paceibacterota bacterium]
MKKIIFFIKTRLVFLFAHVMGFCFFEATSAQDLESVYYLRWKVYGDEGYIQKEDFPHQRLCDKYDDGYAINFLATKNAVPIATTRLIMNSPYNFPTENLFNIKKVEHRNQVHEIARLVITPEFRRKSGRYKRLVMFGLALVMYRFCMKRGVYFWLANMPGKLAESYKSFGAYFHRFPEQQPETSHLQARNVIAGYFKKHVLHPYMVDIRSFAGHGFRLH